MKKTNTTKTIANNTLTVCTSDSNGNTKRVDFTQINFDTFFAKVQDGAKAFDVLSIDKQQYATVKEKAQSKAKVRYTVNSYCHIVNNEQLAKLLAVKDSQQEQRNAKRNSNKATVQSMLEKAQALAKVKQERLQDGLTAITSASATLEKRTQIVLDCINYLNASAQEQQAQVQALQDGATLEKAQEGCTNNLKLPKTQKALATLEKQSHLPLSNINKLVIDRIESGKQPQSDFDKDILQQACDIITKTTNCACAVPQIELYEKAKAHSTQDSDSAQQVRKAYDNFMQTLAQALATVQAR